MTRPWILKSGRNRGNRRIWIEGNRLHAAGFECGDRLTRTIVEGVLTLTRDPEGNHRIAGKPDRPILDCCGQWVTDLIGDHSHFTITTTRNTIGIVPINK
jgi:hypothetical protein